MGEIKPKAFAAEAGATGSGVSHQQVRLPEQSQRFLTTLLEASSQGIVSVDRSGIITLVNLGAEKIFGYERAELLGKHMEILLPERLRQIHSAHQQSYFMAPHNRQMGFGSELSGRRKDGTEFPAEITLSHIATDQGPAVTVFVSDITARKAAQAAAIQASDHFTALLQASSRVAIIATGMDGTIHVFNTGAENMLGYSASEIIGKQTPLVFHVASEVEARSRQLLEQDGVNVSGFHALVEAARKGSYDEREWTYVCKDGRRLTVNLAITAVHDQKGSLTGFLGMASDVSERKAAEAAVVASITEQRRLQLRMAQVLRQTDEALQAILDAAPLAVVTFDRRARIASWNRAAERLFGYSSQEVLGRGFPLRTEHRRALRHLIRLSLAGDSIIARSWQAETREGLSIYGSVSAAPLHDEFGKISGAIVLIEDVTARKALEKEHLLLGAALVSTREDEARRIAAELHDDITQRLALLSMDLGKAAAISNVAGDAILMKSLQRSVLEIAEGIRRISHRLHPAILDDLGLVDAIQDLCGEFERRLGVPVRFSAEGVPQRLRKDVASSLYRVTQESLQNIAKHARAANITVGMAADAKTLELRIEDSGTGFEMDSPSSGLGLHSMRERIRFVNGELKIASQLGLGTSVIVKVPLQLEEL